MPKTSFAKPPNSQIGSGTCETEPPLVTTECSGESADSIPIALELVPRYFLAFTVSDFARTTTLTCGKRCFR